jgi:mRNA-degrading endonuclease HigB of HigAB toxin-antitoxin module
MISKFIYLYHKRHRYLESYVQDLIADKTNFKPYKIKLEITSKENNSIEFNHFIFNYEGLKYDLFDNELRIIG